MPRTPFAGLHLEEIREELTRGGRFVLYYYCLTLFFWSVKRPSRIQLLRAGIKDRWHGMPVSAPGHDAFWRGVPYSLLSLLCSGPLMAGIGLGLAGYLLFTNLPHDHEINVLFVLPVFVLTFWGLPWGYIYFISCLAVNCSGGEDVTEQVWAILSEEEIPELEDVTQEHGTNGTAAWLGEPKDEGKLST